MSSNTAPDAVMQQFLQGGQALAQGFMQWLAQHAGADQSAQAGALPPEIETIRQDWQAQHLRLWQAMLQQQPGDSASPVVQPEPGDRRFANPAWTESPVYDYLRQAYLINASYLAKWVEVLPIADEREKAKARFLTRQYIDAMAPSNFAATNPEFIKQALDSKGDSIRRGIQNLINDLGRGRISMTDESAFDVGGNLATTPGAVVYENPLFQLIQYAPLTDKVARTPLLIVPPCINKYYILDLQAHNSFVRYVVEQGFTVFLVSWRNVKADLGTLTWDDYIQQGVLTALQVAAGIGKVKQVNALGFCVGGTLLTSALAVARARGKSPAKSLTLLTTLLDFSDAGEISCYVDEKTVAMREATLGQGGVFPGDEFFKVFSSLRPNDLIWQYVVGNYLKGNTPAAFDLLYWNADSTNLPGPFLAWYLRNMYLENNLRVPGKLKMAGVPVDLGAIDIPAFALAAREDHIVPWQGAFVSSRLLGGETTFVLGASGHIAGVINPAASNKRSHWVGPREAVDADGWLSAAEEIKGSWWPRWIEWLGGHSGRRQQAKGRLGSDAYPPLEAAPGRYVREKA